ncbi:MAG: hypothetical protein JWN44_5650 [Myxococcales bacterium]|nr:hypothetical protein [Myxococcales bacterium]
MQNSPVVLTLALLSAVGCGGSGSTMTSGSNPDMSSGVVDAGPTIEGQHGTVIDYFSNMPLAGFTVSDGNNTTTTDANGGFLLPAPAGVALAPTVSGPMYTTLHLPEAMAAGVDVNRGAIPIPSSSTFMLEQQVLSNDQTKALVQITVLKSSTCASIAGGTITVSSPAGASVKYFTTQGLPTGTAFAEVDVARNKPVAVVYDVEPGEQLELTITHPTCTVAPRSKPVDGMLLSGHVLTTATEPDDHNSSLVFLLE